MRGSGQRLPITLRFTRVLGTFSHTTCFPFSCALWACFSDRSVSGERSEPIGALMPHAALWVVQRERAHHWCVWNRVSMPHAALWVVQPRVRDASGSGRHCFNAARGFVGGAATDDGAQWLRRLRVSMPHAALWVVQHQPVPSNNRAHFVSMPHAALWVVQPRLVAQSVFSPKFQCRTRLCGWCNGEEDNPLHLSLWFQCRTRLCGWCNCIARSPCPPRGKKPFWKVSENLSVLTENM